MRPTLLLLCLALAACGDPPMAPITPPPEPVAPALVFVSVCDEATVWGFDVDGQRLGLYLFMGRGAALPLSYPAGPHVVERAQWAPVFRVIRDTVTVQDTTRVKLTCR